MVVALGPGKFYGSSLPRPRFFTDVKLNDERVDPPAPVLDPLLSWANEAHWSMGGLSFQRLRLQGRIEGSIKKLRVQQDRSHRRKKAAAARIRSSGVKPASLKTLDSEPSESSEEIAPVTPSPPPKKKRARKLMDEFEMVATEEKGRRSVANDDIDTVSPKKGNEEAVVSVSSRTRSRRSPAEKKGNAGGSATSTAVRRISPRRLMA